MIALESVAKDEEVHSHEVVWRLWADLVKCFENFLFTQFLAALHHFDKLLVFVDCIALLKDNGAHFIQLLLEAAFLNFQFRLRLRIYQ